VRELDLIAQLPAVLGAPGAEVLRGPGDDAAVVRARGYSVTSVDTMIDGVHFRRSQLSPAEIGRRALGAALSDLAAMGATPGEAYVAIGIPAGAGDDALELIAGARALADRLGVTIAGGDITSAGLLVVSMTVVGWEPDPGRLIGRGGARPGDFVAVTGDLGGAGAALAVLDGAAEPPPEPLWTTLRARYTDPEPRLEAARALATIGATAMIDISDGLATDAGHIAHASGVTLELSLASLPVAPGVAPVAEQLGRPPSELAATSGDDYELCVCVAPNARTSAARRLLTQVGLKLTWIGRVRKGPPRVGFSDSSGELAGFEHSF
jgi:thiamine-monophosphate kinase